MNALKVAQPSLLADFSATKHSKKGGTHKRYEMSRRGFSYLILGFTGKKANQFKLDYIDLEDYRRCRLHLVKHS